MVSPINSGGYIPDVGNVDTGSTRPAIGTITSIDGNQITLDLAGNLDKFMLNTFSIDSNTKILQENTSVDASALTDGQKVNIVFGSGNVATQIRLIG